jgi:CxxC motif-containing protein (DUF1111 family)
MAVIAVMTNFSDAATASSAPNAASTVKLTSAAAANVAAAQDVDAGGQARIDLGHAVFNTQWHPAGTENAARRDGLGPLFNASACDACHNEGAHARGPTAGVRLPYGAWPRLRIDRQSAFLHDGRARSIEEAILWHDGEADAARRGFTLLAAERRARLLEWVATR